MSNVLDHRPSSHSFRTPADVKRFFRSIRPYQRHLAAEKDALAKVGARGAVDRVAATAMRAAGIEPLMIAVSFAGGTIGHVLDVGGVEMVFSWNAGVLRGAFDLAPRVRWEFGDVCFDAAVASSMDTHTHERPIR